MICNSITELIGNTPLLRLSAIEKEFELKANIYAKLEFFNPGGSVKDRVSLNMIEDAERNGILKEGSVIIEPTSGNTGIGLAMVALTKGYKTIIVMPETMSVERQLLMKAYGAELVLTDGAAGMAGAIKKANELKAAMPCSFIPGQFENEANPKAHFNTTGPEIYNDLNGNVAAFVAGVGTGGTISGTGEYLKSKNENIKIIAVEPDSSPVLTKGQGGSHKIQGIGAGFVPKALNPDVLDEIITVSDEDALKFGAMICKKMGALVGISSGAALFAAITMAKREEYEGKNIVVLFPDTGSRYLSTSMFNE